MGGRRLTDNMIIDALNKSLGIQTYAAKLLNCQRETISRRVAASPRVRAAINEAYEKRLDLAESRLFDAISKGEPWAVKFMLSLQGGKRGYREHKEIEVNAKAESKVSVLPTEELERIVRERAAEEGEK